MTDIVVIGENEKIEILRLEEIAEETFKVSTVAFESCFSTSGRVLDVFRSSLSPKTFYDKDFDQFDSIEKIIDDVSDKIPQSQGANEETTTMNID
ncbi:hypothetical protein Lal_00008555 [Lupinus albus]|nr:hypothetical protein Lal_00008555 [Lupinus albus]